MTDVQTRTSTEHQHEEPTRPDNAAPRRAVLAGAGALGATCFLAACGTSTTGASGTNPAGTDYAADPAPAGSKGADADGTGKDAGGGTTSGGGGAVVLAAVADVPVGGGVIKGKYVVTQPDKGTYKAFSSICPHAQCTVGSIKDGTIICPCHGSKFSVTDGSVTNGPAQTGLPETSVKVADGNIVAA
jgi:nitrite reductase/ring-hydroxylating ferredoxin subunit